MKPKLIDISILENDIKQYKFTKNSIIVNCIIGSIIVMFFICILFVFKPKLNKKQRNDNALSQLYNISKTTDNYIHNGGTIKNNI